jgi:hypothetical protein
MLARLSDLVSGHTGICRCNMLHAQVVLVQPVFGEPTTRVVLQPHAQVFCSTKPQDGLFSPDLDEMVCPRACSLWLLYTIPGWVAGGAVGTQFRVLSCC